MAAAIALCHPKAGTRISRRIRGSRLKLLRLFMRRRYPQVSWELILSGRGFRTLHEFLAPKVIHATFEDPDADPAPEITRRGLDKSCRVCSDTLVFGPLSMAPKPEILR